MSGFSPCLHFWCLVVILFTLVRAQDNFEMFPANTEGWLNPDDAFSPSRSLKSNREVSSGIDTTECQENLNALVERYSECEKARQALSSKDGNEEKVLEETTVTNPPMQCAEERNGAKVYLQRFIHQLLEVSNLNNREVETENKAELKFLISNDQLTTLRQFAKDGNIKAIPLRKLDEIFGSVFVRPYFTLPDFYTLVDKLPSIQIGSFFVSAILPILWFLSILVLTRNISRSFLWLTPVVFLTSYITTASHMFEEAEVKQYENMQKYLDIPKDCMAAPSLLNWLFSSGQSDCSKHLKAHHMDPNLGITPVKVLSKMFGETVAEAMAYFGSGTFDFIVKFEEMGWFSRMWALPSALVLLYSVFALVFLAFTRGSIKLPYFMGSVNFNNSNSNTSVPSAHSTSFDAIGPHKVDALPSASNITVNFHQVHHANVHDILRSISNDFNQPPAPPLGENIGRPRPVLSSFGAIEDLSASGDGLQNSQGVMSSSTHHRHPNRQSVGSNKQFSQLNSKYKSSFKIKKSIKRARNMSL